jgi:hypothetical protein
MRPVEDMRAMLAVLAIGCKRKEKEEGKKKHREIAIAPRPSHHFFDCSGDSGPYCYSRG